MSNKRMPVMTVEEAFPKELTNVLDSPEFDNEAGIMMESAQFTEYGVDFRFSIRFFEDPQQMWSIRIEGVKEEKLVRDWTQSIALYSKHPLLLGHAETYTELYFKGTTSQPNGLFTELFKRIIELSEEMEEVLPYILTPNRINEVSQQRFGLFARGPKTILKIYEQCLKEYGIHAYYISEYEQSINDRNLKLFKLGDSYIIAQSFLFKREQ